MHRDMKFTIINEGLQNGISKTCQKYHISRTIYYRWLHRYKETGLDGLNDIVKNYTPPNKTSAYIESKTLNLIKAYPTYGPRAIKYLLDEININISESAVFNIMKRYQLTNKEKRLKFSRKRKEHKNLSLPDIDYFGSGECWIQWITDFGCFDNIGNIYQYTILDLKSRIACSRLYANYSFDNLQELMTAVAIPVGQSLKLNMKYLCYDKNLANVCPSNNKFHEKIDTLLTDNGLDIEIYELDGLKSENHIEDLCHKYTQGCLEFLLPLIHENISFSELKISFQQYIRDYNMNHKQLYSISTDNAISEKELSPIQYHNEQTGAKVILPIWAYIDREY